MNTNTDTKTDICLFCPHCKELVLIEQLNCCIFRHGILIESGKQIDPHASKELCDYYIEKNKILCSVSSICQTSSSKSSFVLDEIGIKHPLIKKGILRFSFNEENTIKEIKYLIFILQKLIKIDYKKYNI